jgi:diguanylate cyclase (GGDEF)-like protein
MDAIATIARTADAGATMGEMFTRAGRPGGLQLVRGSSVDRPAGDATGDLGQPCGTCGQVPHCCSSTDKLTGLPDRWTWDIEAAKAFSRARGHHQPAALLFLDLDRFKEINDEHGHPAGDAILRAVALTIQANTRLTDVVGRYGGRVGDEFLVLLPATPFADVLTIAERIRNDVRNMTVEVKTSRYTTANLTGQTVSIGIAVYSVSSLADADLIDLMLDADSALRAAKRNGRDQIRVVDPHYGEFADPRTECR